MKLVTIIIPYNKNRGWLDQAINSVEYQSYKNIELILSQSDNGVSYNINQGIMKSKGDYIKYLCEDDVLPKDSIEKSVANFKNDIIFGNAMNFRNNIGDGEKFIPILKNLTLKNMLAYNYVHGGGLMYKREVFDKIGLFNESITTGEEYEFNLRALSYGLKFHYVDNVLYYYRHHERQKSIGNSNTTYQALRQKQLETIKNWYR